MPDPDDDDDDDDYDDDEEGAFDKPTVKTRVNEVRQFLALKLLEPRLGTRWGTRPPFCRSPVPDDA